ncbi:MAG: L-Ala-D/L-Glu epimerase [Actinomycetota bacterium]|nr:L-Ala-D/L-Glu epimerase [Actinomycetota bacterium]
MNGAFETEASAQVREVRLPMARSFSHAGAVRRRSESVVFALSGHGVTGYGECAPRVYVTGESSGDVVVGLTRWWRDHGSEVTRLLATDALEHELLDWLHTTLTGHGANEVCALELAFTDWAEQAGRSARPALPEPSCAAFVPVQDGSGRWSVPETVAGTASVVKIKTVSDLAGTLERVRAARDLVRGDVVVDANNAWQGDAAVAAAAACHDAGATWLEEPAPARDYRTLRRIRAAGVKVLLDESVTTADDLRRAVAAEALDAVNIRIAKCGGPRRALRIARTAADQGVGRYYGVQVAEVGTLIPAGRRTALADADPMAVEAGQSDLFFAPDQLWTAACPTDRTTAHLHGPTDGRLNGRHGHDR